MADNSILPKAGAPLVDQTGRPTRAFYSFFNALVSNLQGQINTISKLVKNLALVIAALGGDPDSGEGIPDISGQIDSKADKSITIAGLGSIQGGGDLSQDRYISLDGDVDNVPGVSFYGSPDGNVKGWTSFSGNFTPAVDVDDNVTLDLADLADSGTGTALVKITRDAKGRISGSSAATTTDLTEGSNLYFTNERAQDAAGAALDGTGDVPLTYNDAGNKISAALSTAVLASLALADSATQPGDLATVATTGAYADLSGLPTLGTAAATDATDYATAAQGTKADSAVQSVVAGTNVTVDNTDPQNPVISATGGGGGSGDVVGPASAVDGDVALFDGITGKLIKSGGALDKAAVGLGNVDNTSDVNKPVSTAQQTAFDLKGPLTSGVLAYRTTAQSIPSATSTKIAFEATSYDDGGYFSTSTPTRLTVPAAGKYRVSFVVGFAAAAAGNRLAFAQRNNADFPGRPAQRITPSGGLDYLSSTSAVVACAAGDYFELVANQTSSGAINVSSDSATLWFSIERLS